jgi:hypothetical protein
MKTYEATYTDQNGKIVSETTFEAQNLKEAKKKANFTKDILRKFRRPVM